MDELVPHQLASVTGGFDGAEAAGVTGIAAAFGALRGGVRGWALAGPRHVRSRAAIVAGAVTNAVTWGLGGAAVDTASQIGRALNPR